MKRKKRKIEYKETKFIKFLLKTGVTQQLHLHNK